MPGNLTAALQDASEVSLTVTGRATGRQITNPVWFVDESSTIYLLPVRGTSSDWFKNVVAMPQVELAADNASGAATATAMTDPAQVSEVVGKFRAKYGADQIAQYYSRLDAAVEARLA